MSGTNGNGHKTPVPSSTSQATILRKLEGLPAELRDLDAYQLGAFAAFTVLEATEKLESLTQEVRAGGILDRDTATRVSALEETAGQSATQESVDALIGDVARLKANLSSLGDTIDKHADGIMEAIGTATAARREAADTKREAHASDVDLQETVEREREAREAEDARIVAMVQKSVTPIVQSAVSVASVGVTEAATEQASKTRKVIAVATGGLTTVYTVVQILREAGVIK